MVLHRIENFSESHTIIEIYFCTNKIFKYLKNRADPRTLNDISLVIYEVFKIVDNEIMNFGSLPYIIKGNN